MVTARHTAALKVQLYVTGNLTRLQPFAVLNRPGF
jgi:hypothetical protein